MEKSYAMEDWTTGSRAPKMLETSGWKTISSKLQEELFFAKAWYLRKAFELIN